MSAVEASSLHYGKRLDDLQKIATESIVPDYLISLLLPLKNGGFYNWGHQPPSYDHRIYPSPYAEPSMEVEAEGADGSLSRYRFQGHIIFTRFLATHCPLVKSDLSDAEKYVFQDLFYKAIAHQPVIAVFNLTSKEDIRDLKTNSYFPTDTSQETQSTCKQIIVRHLKRSPKEREHYFINHYNLETNDELGIKINKNIHHILVEDWVDGQDVSFERLHALVLKAERIRKKNLPGIIAVHCLAGLGRTGTFIVACEIARLVREKILTIDNLKLTVAALILTTRDQRSASMISAKVQIGFLFDYARILVNNPGYLC